MKLKDLKYERMFYVSIIVLILITFIISLRPLKRENEYKANKFWLNKTIAEPIYDIVIIGDSRIYRGISPKEIKKYLPNKNILNFGYSSARLSSLLFKQAEKKLLKTNKNKIIIIGISPNALISKAYENEHLTESLKKAHENKYEILYFNDFLKYFEPIRGRDFRKDNSPKYIEKYYNDGWIASDKELRDTNEAIISYKDWFSKKSVSKKLINKLINQVGIWKNKNITVYGFYMPTSWSMKQIEDSLSGFNEEIFSAKFENAGGIWFHFNKNYKSYDGSHLTEKSAIEFSNDLGKKIKKVQEIK